MEEMREIESREQLEAFHRRYTTGSITGDSIVCFIHAYDKDGNELVLKSHAGGKIEYQEIPARQKE